jgi:hypothetical protein
MARIYQDETRGSAERDGARHFRLLSAAVVSIALSAAVQTRNCLETSGIRHVVRFQEWRGWCS